jgi:hypothetical protein
MEKYRAMTHDDYDAILLEILSEMQLRQLFGIRGVFEALSQEFHNEIHRRWEELYGTPETK